MINQLLTLCLITLFTCKAKEQNSAIKPPPNTHIFQPKTKAVVIPPPLISIDDALHYLGKPGTVVGRLADYRCTGKQRGYLIIIENHPPYASMRIILETCPLQSKTPWRNGMLMSVTGKVVRSDGLPIMRITNPDQITRAWE